MSQIAPWLRELLRDPVDVSPLTDAEQVQAPGADYYLVNREATRAYPVRDGVAMLLPR